MKRAVIYTRFSTRPDAATSESCEYQEEFCRDWCEKNGYEVESAHQDRGISGTVPIEDRPGLTDALCALKRGQYLVIYHWDRLARDRMVHVSIESFVNGLGGHMICAANGQTTKDESPEDELVRSMMQTMSAYQRQVNALRTKTSMLSYQRNGRIMSKRLPYGFEVDQDNPTHMVKEPAEQEILRSIREMRDGGLGFRKIAKTLTNNGTKPRIANAWSANTIRQIIRREKSNIA